MTTDTTLWVIVERAQDGDAEAFGMIYDRYFDTVFRFVYFRVGNRPLAEDLTSDTFLRALKRIGSFTWQGRDLGAWLVTIARNLIADHYKSAHYRRALQVGDVLGDRPNDNWRDDPEVAALGHMADPELMRAVKLLAPEQRQCIALRFIWDLSVEETAEAMGKSISAVKSLQFRAVRVLRQDERVVALAVAT